VPLPNAPAERLIARFRTDVARLADVAGDVDDRPIAVAVSGGGDSLALLLLAAHGFPGRIVAFTADHGLRPESAAEAAEVARICVLMGVPHRTLLLSELAGTTANIQARARAARYAAMAGACGETGAQWLLTAHHADDQAETLLMRLARGSGVDGLAGIRVARAEGGITLLRPLLGWRKRELAEIVRDAALVPADDPSNSAARYDRTHARALLAAAPWIDPLRVAAAASHLADAQIALQWVEDRAWAGNVRRDGQALFCMVDGLPDEIVRRLVRRALLAVDAAADVRGDSLDRLIAQLRQGGVATLGMVRADGRMTGEWRFSPAPARAGDVSAAAAGDRSIPHCAATDRTYL